MKRLLLLGDAHCGLKVGLLPPGLQDEYGKKYGLGKAQRFIWHQVQEAEEWAGSRISALVIMGDAVHGDKDMYQRQIEIGDVKGQADAFIEAVKPLAARADAVYVIDDLSRFHVDDGRFAMQYVAQELGAVGRQAYPKIEVKFEDLTIGIAHHGPTLGMRPQTRGNPVREYLRDIAIEALADRRQPPDISVFAHWHQYYHEAIDVPTMQGKRTVHAYFTPALCAADKLTIRNIKKLVLSDIGTLGMEIVGNKHSTIPMYEHFDNMVRLNHE